MIDRPAFGASVDLRRDVRLDIAGRRITEADACSAADAAERCDLLIDLAAVVYPRRRGRPALSDEAAPGAVSPKIEARVPVEMKARLARYARAHRKTTAEVVRAALDEFLAKS